MSCDALMSSSEDRIPYHESNSSHGSHPGCYGVGVSMMHVGVRMSPGPGNGYGGHPGAAGVGAWAA